MHNVVDSPESAAIQSLAAGVDIELPNPAAYPTKTNGGQVEFHDVTNRCLEHIEHHRLDALIVIGGDTASALVGDDTLACLGTVAPGIPASPRRA